MAEIPTRWIYNTLDLTSSRASSRSALPKSVAWSLVGVDGSQQGSLRPLNGFRNLHLIERPDEANVAITDHNTQSTLVDFWPVSFHLGTDGYAYGVVYSVSKLVVVGPATFTYHDFFLDYWESATETLHRAIRIAVDKPVDDASVTCIGRFIFVCVRGATPTLSYWDEVTEEMVTVATPGPGAEPTLAVGGGSGNRITITNSAGAWANLPAESYSFAYGFIDTRTGRRGPISKTATVAADDFPTTDGATPKATLYIEEVDGTKWDKIVMYRSPSIQTVGDARAAGILFVDQIVDVPDLEDADQDLNFAYELEDKALVSQEPFTQRDKFDQQIPYGGCSMAFGGTLVLSRIAGTPASGGDTTDSFLQSSLGEIRWSSTLKVMPEHFSPFNRYTTKVPANEVISMVEAGEYAFGFSKDRLYHMKKMNGAIRPIEIHQGYGICSRDAACSVGGMVYFATDAGLKAVAGNGQLDDVAALDDDFVRTWRTSRGSVSLGYDTTALCLFVLNPTEKECRVLWMGTHRVTQIKDTPFSRVRSGWWASNFWLGADDPDYTSGITQRALFLRKRQSSGWGSDVVHEIMCLDSERLKIPICTTLDFGSGLDGRMVIELGSQAGEGPTELDIGLSLGAVAKGAKLYVLQGTTVGTSWTITGIAGTVVTLDGTHGIVAGDVIGLNPVLFEWVGSNIHRAAEDPGGGEVVDLFRNKQLSSIGAVFSSVVNGGADDPASARTFLGGVYVGLNDEPEAEAPVKNLAGAQVEAVVEGASASYAAPRRFTVADGALSPSLRIFVPELDFRLLSVLVRGTITSSDRNRRSE